jgi:hypothetical protein
MAGPDRIVNEVCVQRKRSTKSSNRTLQQKNNLALVEKGSVRTGKIATKIDPRRAPAASEMRPYQSIGR